MRASKTSLEQQEWFPMTWQSAANRWRYRAKPSMFLQPKCWRRFRFKTTPSRPAAMIWIASFKNQHFILYAYSVVSLQQFGKDDSRLPRAFLSAARAAFEPAEAELLSCAWRQPRSNRNQKSSPSSQIKALMQDWNELADEKGNFELQGTCGAGALWTWAKKLGALSNANLLPDPGSKIPSQSKGRV